MQKSFTKWIFGSLLILLLVVSLGACQTAEPTTAPAEPTSPPTATKAPSATNTATLVPSATPTNTPEPTQTPVPTATPASSGPDNFAANVNPLTGLTVDDPSVLERNPVMVKVSNFPRGLRPHSGLSSADLVFEHYIGAGATRFSAIYYGENPSEVGPVRSARLVDAQLGRAYNTVFAFASADPFVFQRVLAALGDFAITESPNTCPVICRIGNGDVNSVRAYTELLTDYAEENFDIVPSRPNLDGMRFDPIAPEGGSAAIKVTIKYAITTISEWRYNPDTGLYLRYIEEANGDDVTIVPLVDRLTDEQLTAANVIVLFADTIEYKPTLHDFELLGNTQGRRALLFRDGEVHEIVWRSQGPRQPIQFFTLSGELIPLKPGQTWIHIVGATSSLDEVSSAQWEVFNLIP
jgi:hypothetical protein